MLYITFTYIFCFRIGYTGGIDPQVYIDTQSSGLASRIVMYSEKNQPRHNIKPIMYNRPGEFPLVHLNKKRLTYNPLKNPMPTATKLKIAAPGNFNDADFILWCNNFV